MNSQGDLISVLRRIETNDLFEMMLEDPDKWESLDVDYLPPRVERLWTTFGPYRVSLHRIHPCGPGEEPFYHPHKWPAAFHVLAGTYEMPYGFGAGVKPPVRSGTMFFAPGSYYSMLDSDMWHAVKVHPGATCLTVMLSGPPWEREMPAVPDKPLRPLSRETKEEMLHLFRSFGGFYWGKLP